MFVQQQPSTLLDFAKLEVDILFKLHLQTEDDTYQTIALQFVYCDIVQEFCKIVLDICGLKSRR